MLTGSVGRNGANKPDDIKVIQKLLNRHASAVGFDRLSEDEGAKVNAQLDATHRPCNFVAQLKQVSGADCGTREVS